jgi:hypothetical protein
MKSIWWHWGVEWGPHDAAPRCVRAKHPWSAAMIQILSHVLFNLLLTPGLRCQTQQNNVTNGCLDRTEWRTSAARQTCSLFCKAALRISQSLVTSLLAAPTRVSWFELRGITDNITVIYEWGVQGILLYFVQFALQTHNSDEIHSEWVTNTLPKTTLRYNDIHFLLPLESSWASRTLQTSRIRLYVAFMKQFSS